MFITLQGLKLTDIKMVLISHSSSQFFLKCLFSSDLICSLQQLNESDRFKEPFSFRLEILPQLTPHLKMISNRWSGPGGCSVSTRNNLHVI